MFFSIDYCYKYGMASTIWSIQNVFCRLLCHLLVRTHTVLRALERIPEISKTDSFFADFVNVVWIFPDNRERPNLKVSTDGKYRF